MGSGFKDFAAGDVLTAADVDGYLMRQTVMTFADASARDTALSGVLDEGMVAYLDVNALTVYNGSAWVAVIDSDVLTVDTANNRVGINDATPSYALDVTGDINASGDLRIGGAAVGEWTSYTPSWTNLTVGNGTVIAEYAQINEIVFYRIKLLFGSTTSVTGDVKVSLPLEADEIYLGGVGGGCHYEQSGSPDYWGPIFRWATTAVAPSVLVTNSTYGSYDLINASVPFTWTTGNILTIEDFYKPA